MSYAYLKARAREMIAKYPTLKGRITDIVELARDEIAEEPCSEEHESELALSELNDLEKEMSNEKKKA